MTSPRTWRRRGPSAPSPSSPLMIQGGWSSRSRPSHRGETGMCRGRCGAAHCGRVGIRMLERRCRLVQIESWLKSGCSGLSTKWNYCIVLQAFACFHACGLLLRKLLPVPLPSEARRPCALAAEWQGADTAGRGGSAHAPQCAQNIVCFSTQLPSSLNHS